jgi:DNA-binding transcriptional MocR family regulator
MYPKQETIADKVGISLSSVKRAIKELSQVGLIVYETKNTNKYCFTSKIFDLCNMTPTTVQNGSSASADLKLLHVHEQIKKQKKNILSFSSNLTEFQKKYADVFQKLSKNEVEKYKSLQGFEKEHWLKAKRKEYFQIKSSNEIQKQIAQDKQSLGSPLDFKKEEAINWWNNSPDFIKRGFFGREIAQRYNLT